MSTHELIGRIDTLTKALKETQLLIQRLSQLQPSSSDDPSSTSDDASIDEARADLSGDIHANLKQYEDDLEITKQDVEDLFPNPGAGVPKRRSTFTPQETTPTEKIATRLNSSCLKFEEDLKLARSRFRKAQLQAKANAERAGQRERAAYISNLQKASQLVPGADDENTDGDSPNKPQQQASFSEMTAQLFAGRRGPRKDPNATQEDMVLSATTDVTSALRRTHNLLSTEVSRSRFAHETLETSNAALKELNDRYISFEDLLTKTRGVVATLYRSQKSDTWYLETAVYLLVGTIAWLIFRKLLYGPLYLFLILPLKIFYWFASLFFGIVVRFTRPVESGSGVSTIRASLTTMPTVSGGSQASVSGAGAQQSSIPVVSSGDAGPERSPPGSLSESIGATAEAAGTPLSSTALPQRTEQAGQHEQQQQGQEQSQDQGSGSRPQEDAQDGQVRRADGRVLRDRDEATEPRNPKKRMWQEPPEPGQQDSKKDEL